MFLESSYHDVLSYIPKMWDGTSVIVEEGIDERNGSYSYEKHISLRKARYRGESPYVLVTSYAGGLNRSDFTQGFESWGDAVKYAHRCYPESSAIFSKGKAHAKP